LISVMALLLLFHCSSSFSSPSSCFFNNLTSSSSFSSFSSSSSLSSSFSLTSLSSSSSSAGGSSSSHLQSQPHVPVLVCWLHSKRPFSRGAYIRADSTSCTICMLKYVYILMLSHLLFLYTYPSVSLSIRRLLPFGLPLSLFFLAFS